MVVRADVRQIIGGADGMLADLDAYLPLPGCSRRLIMFAGPSMTYANHRYVHKEFGVTTTQSIASGYPVYDAHAGSEAVGFGFSATGFISTHWLINVDMAVNHLLGSAADSPITQKTTQHVLALSVAYTWLISPPSGPTGLCRSAGVPLSLRGPAPMRVVAGFGFWLFLLSDIIVFAALFAVYAVLSHSTAGGPGGAELFEKPRVSSKLCACWPRV